MPRRVDLRDMMTPVQSQGTLQSSVACALAAACGFLIMKNSDKHIDVSRLFIYYNGREKEGNCYEDDGTTIVLAVEALEQLGCCEESTWPYDPTMVLQKPTEQAYKEAMRYRVSEKISVDTELNAMKACLAQGYPFVFGIQLFESFGQADDPETKRKVPLPQENEKEGSNGLWWHAMLAVGYSDRSRCFIVRNSYGDKWGDNGYCYIPYDYMSNPKLCLESYSLRALSDDRVPYLTSTSSKISSVMTQPTSTIATDQVKGPPAQTSPTACSRFYTACRNNDIELVKEFLETITPEAIDKVEPNGSTALHAASYLGHQEIVELLLQKGANPAIINKYNCTPLEEAKTDVIKQLITRRKTTRFCSVTVEWILATNDADYQAHEYWKKLETYGKDPKFYQLINYIKQHYIQKDLKEIDGIDSIKQYFDHAVNERDPLYLIKAYTAETGFYSTLNVNLAQLHLKNLTTEGNISLAYLIGIIARHPKFDELSYVGTTYRGMLITGDDLKQYKIGTRILTKTFSSTSKEMSIARRFLSSSVGDDRLNAICTYTIRNQRTALNIEEISVFKREQEVIILPYSAFKIINIVQNKSQAEIKLKECEPWD
ncbi:unnamed protein product [Didymodactylos carnosus]|uniref:NAD(P)(+)--arginine ADP-ribosyltransferase n=2 Tax=Didymodactylos carnosus TaxID=1234261 RepID=A0A815FEX9_9BILA|nr:unnamed protein product [Didymodactylos carnosus]CAF4169856.1 unnamed protein product [Didymodactylos carnosus]